MRTSLAFAVSVLLLAASPPARAAEADSDNWDARITAVKGDATVFTGSEEEGVPAEENHPLEAGDQVRTGSNGRVEIALAADTVLELGPDSQITISALARKNSLFKLLRGLIVAKVKLAAYGGRMSIQTRNVSAAVRGTEFSVSEDEEDGTVVGVFDEGRVAVSSVDDESAPEAVVTPNHEVVVQSPKTRRFEIRALKKHKKHRRRVKHIRKRHLHFAKHWKAMGAKARASRRSQIRRSHKGRMKNMSPKQRLKMRNKHMRGNSSGGKGRMGPRGRGGNRGRMGPGRRGGNRGRQENRGGDRERGRFGGPGGGPGGGGPR